MKKPTLILAIWIAACFLLANFIPAAAHAGLVDSEPSPGASLPSSPEVIRLTFSEPILENSTFSLMTEDFREIDGVDPSINPERPEQLYAFVPPLEAGTYTVQWKAVSEDGGETSGSFAFQVRGSTGLSLWFVGLVAVIAILVLIGLGLLIRRLQTGDSQKNLLENIREGMTVYDKEGRELGKVDRVHTGAQKSELPYTYGGTLPGKKPGEDDSILAKIIEEYFDPMDKLHEEIQEELYLHGFIRLLTGKLEGQDRYIQPHQIHSISEEGVHLHTSEEDLKK